MYELLTSLKPYLKYWWIPGLSVLMMILILIGSGIAVVFIPPDYFQTRRPSIFERLKTSSIPMCIYLVAKNLFSVLFLTAGFLMLALPGPGWLSILVGLFLIDFPKKKSFERWIVRRSAIRTTVDKLRAIFDRPELDIDADHDSEED